MSILRTTICAAGLLLAEVLFAGPAHLKVHIPGGRESPLVMLVGIDDTFLLSRMPFPGTDLSLEVPSEGYYMLETRYPSGRQHVRTVVIPAGTSRSRPHKVDLSPTDTLFATDLAQASHVVPVGILGTEDDIQKALSSFEAAMESGDTERAEEILSGMLNNAPQAALAWNNLGALRLAQGKVDEAIELLRRAKQLDDSLFEGNLNYGRALFAKHQYEAAYRCAVRALEIRPRNPNASALAAQTLFLMGKREESVPHLLCTLEVDPRHVSFPDLLLAVIYQDRGDTEVAAHHVLDWAKKHPTHPDATSLRRQALLSLREHKEPSKPVSSALNALR